VVVVGADNKATQRLVEVAPNRVGSDAVILKGIEPGERFVAEGVQKLREGGRVQPMTAPELAAANPPADKPAAAGVAEHGENKSGKE